MSFKFSGAALELSLFLQSKARSLHPGYRGGVKDVQFHFITNGLADEIAEGQDVEFKMTSSFVVKGLKDSFCIVQAYDYRTANNPDDMGIIRLFISFDGRVTEYNDAIKAIQNADGTIAVLDMPGTYLDGYNNNAVHLKPIIAQEMQFRGESIITSLVKCGQLVRIDKIPQLGSVGRGGAN